MSEKMPTTPEFERWEKVLKSKKKDGSKQEWQMTREEREDYYKKWHKNVERVHPEIIKILETYLPAGQILVILKGLEAVKALKNETEREELVEKLLNTPEEEFKRILESLKYNR